MKCTTQLMEEKREHYFFFSSRRRHTSSFGDWSSDVCSPISVLASPLVGVSNDTLVLLRRAAPKRPLFTGLERGLPEGVEPDDRRLLRAFLQRYERLVLASSRLRLERLCEEIVTEHDYDLAVLACWDGSRRFANLRKLGRLDRKSTRLNSSHQKMSYAVFC